MHLVRARWSNPYFLAVLLTLGLVCLHWPGNLTPDSLRQWQQAQSGQFDDWHPPIMAQLWRLVGAQQGAMLAIQALLYGVGVGCLGDVLKRRDRPIWPVMLAACTPIALKYVGVIQKDSLLAAALLAGTGLAMRFGAMAGLPALILGGLARANAVFAVPPLLRRGRVWVWVAVALAAIPVSGWINRSVLAAKPTGVERSLQRFDLAGIAHFSGRPAPCYTPLFWDTLADCEPMPAGSLTRRWLSEIAAHPIAYAEHRLAHFNRTTFFLVEPMQQCVVAPAHHRCDFSTKGYLKDALEKNLWLWPILWLGLGLVLLAHPLNDLAKPLVWSAMLFGWAYLLVGVASDFRYFFWTELAVQMGIALQFADGLPWRRMAIMALVIAALGYGARLVWLLG